MPAVDPAVPEPPAYPPIEPQPTLPGLPVSAYEAEAATRPEAVPEPPPGVVLSLTRDTARGGAQASRVHGRAGGIERLLRLAAARGASALYLTTQARPAVRVDGDIRLLEGEATLSSGDVEAAVLELAPEGARDKESAEWIRDLQDVGRVRITTFRDYRGPGALLRMISARATSAEQLGLVREIQALAMEPEGLVIVTGPRASGKSTLVSAYVDLINRQRNDYVITLEGQIRLVHESRGSLISQRELRGSAGEIVSAARAALRENPDVLIIEDLRSPDVLQVALDAAGSGLLVFASVTAASATAALERLVDLCPSEQRRTVRAALAEHLRGVVAQVLLRKAGGGPARRARAGAQHQCGRRPGQRRPDRRSCRAPSTAAASSAWRRSTTRWWRSCRAARWTCARPTARPTTRWAARACCAARASTRIVCVGTPGVGRTAAAVDSPVAPTVPATVPGPDPSFQPGRSSSSSIVATCSSVRPSRRTAPATGRSCCITRLPRDAHYPHDRLRRIDGGVERPARCRPRASAPAPGARRPTA